MAMQLLPGSVPRSDESSPATNRRAFARKHSLFGLTFATRQTPQEVVNDLPKRGEEWRWLNVVAFFSAAFFGLGSTLFVVGAGTSLAAPFLAKQIFDSWKRRALVDYAYGIGGCYFTIGSYLSHYEVINVGRERRRFFSGPSGGTSLAGYWGSLSYFVGACCFQISVTMTVLFPTMAPWVSLSFSWVPQAFGGIGFTLAAIIEQSHNSTATWREYVFWVCWLYLFGSMLFLFAAASGTAMAAAGTKTEVRTQLYVDLPYLIGSAFFLFGAWAQLLMWKAEQFGLGFISEINRPSRDWTQSVAAAEAANNAAPPADIPVSSSSATHSTTDGVASKLVDQLSLAVYLANGALSAVNVSLSYVWHASGAREDAVDREARTHVHTSAEKLLEAEELLSDTTAFLAAHCMLLLATAVHFTPTLKPYGHLLWLMRGIAVLLLACGSLRCVKFLHEATFCVSPIL